MFGSSGRGITICTDNHSSVPVVLAWCCARDGSVRVNPNQYCFGHILPTLFARFISHCLVCHCWLTDVLQLALYRCQGSYDLFTWIGFWFLDYLCLFYLWAHQAHRRQYGLGLIRQHEWDTGMLSCSFFSYKCTSGRVIDVAKNMFANGHKNICITQIGALCS